MISTSGPGMASATLVVLPILWGAPVSLACAELSARKPVEGGYYRWARLGFGAFDKLSGRFEEFWRAPRSAAGGLMTAPHLTILTCALHHTLYSS